MPVDELALPGRHNVSQPRSPRSRSALLFGVAPDAIRRAAAAFRGVEHRLEPVAEVDGVRFVNDSQGTQPDAVIAALRGLRRRRSCSSPAAATRASTSPALGPVVAERAAAAVLIGESGPALAALLPGGRPGTRGGRAARWRTPLPRAAAIAREAARRRPAGRRPGAPCSSRRPRRASTCSPTTPPAVAPSRRPSRALARHAAARERQRGRWAEDRRRSPTGRHPAVARDRRRDAPAPRAGARRGRRRLARRGRTPARRSRAARAPRARTWSILVAVVALTALGILMVYSSSAMRAYVQRERHARRSSARRSCGRPSGSSPCSSIMRVDYRWLRARRLRASLVARRAARPRPRPRASVTVVGGSARWLQLGPLPVVHPAEFAKLALVVYLAHWIARRGTAVRGAPERARCPFLVIVAPFVAARLQVAGPRARRR